MIINLNDTNTEFTVRQTESTINIQAGGPRGIKGADGLITEIGAGNGISIDNTNPAQPIVTATTARIEYVLVKTLSDFPYPTLGLIQLADNTTYEINGQVNIGTNQLVYGVNSFITGLNYGRDAIIYTGTAAAVISNGNKVNITQIGLVAPNGRAIEADCGANLFTAFLCGFFSKDGAYVTNASVASFKFCLFQGIAGFVTPERHLTFEGTFDKILLSENPFYPIPENSTAVVFNNIQAKVVDVTGNFFKLGTGNWNGVEWISELEAPTEFGIYQGNTFEGDFTNTVGFDQTTVGWSFTGNSGIANSRTYGGWGFTGRTTPLTITTQNEWVKIDSGATPKPLERFTYENSSITYVGRRDVPLLIIASITAEVPNNNVDFEFAIYVNNVQVVGTLEQIGFRFSNTSQSLTMNSYIDVSQGDVIDIRCRNLTNTDDILISSLSVTVNSA